MKTQSLATLVALAATLQGVVAIGWHDAPSFKCPTKNPENCVPKQHGGFDWSDLVPGPFADYGGFKFHGFSCQNSFAGSKRDQLLPRTFNAKCITGQASSDKSSCPKVSAGTVDKFSITHLQVSVEFDVDLEFHYTLPDKSICKHKASCKKAGSVVENTQCGGATDVTVVFPAPPKTGPKTCKVGIHSVGFNCPSSTSSGVQPTGTPTTVQTSPPVITATSEASATTSNSPETTPGAETSSTVPAGETTTAPAGSESSTTPGSETTTIPGVPGNATQGLPTTTAPAPVTLTTVVVEETVTTCPVTTTHVTSGVTSIETSLTVSTISITTTKTFCPKCTKTHGGPAQTSPAASVSSPAGSLSSPVASVSSPAASVSAPVASVSSSSPNPSSVPEAPCPPILPQCLNTWLPDNCTSNSDTACFCPIPDFTAKVFGCLSAHGATQAEIDSAAAYFQGLCATYVPTNPGLIVDCPAPSSNTTRPGPVTTIILQTTITVPCQPESGTVTTSSTISTVSTAITVPQVALTTVTSGSVNIVPGTAPPAVAATATVAPATATVAPATATGVQATVPGAAVPAKTSFAVVATPAPTKAGSVGTNTIAAPSAIFTGAATKGSVGAGVLGAAVAFAVLF